MSDERRIHEVLARYVRATDRRDGQAQGALFTDDALVQIYAKNGPDSYEQVGEPVRGGAGVEYAVTHFMPAHPEGGSSHHTTSDHIIEIDDDRAHLNAQFIVFDVRAATRSAAGAPGTGAQSVIRPVESGYYDTDLRFLDDTWKITHHRVLMDTPWSLPDT